MKYKIFQPHPGLHPEPSSVICGTSQDSSVTPSRDGVVNFKLLLSSSLVEQDVAITETHQIDGTSKDAGSNPAVVVNPSSENRVQGELGTGSETSSYEHSLSSAQASDGRLKEQEANSSLDTTDPTPAPIPLGKEGDKERDAASQPMLSEGYKALDIESPLELIALIDDYVRTGRVNLHKWQIETAEELGLVKPDAAKPYKFVLCAANGSGKDKYIVAPFVVWFACAKIRSLSIITSSSGTQLTSQTENYIATLARAVNTKFRTTYGGDIFKVTRRYIKCLLSGSEIRMFATDEEGKAEGYHPLEPGADMAIIVNEAKSVKKEIFQALGRCTGYNYWLNVSTPGEPSGNFFYSWNTWKHRRKVTAYDCIVEDGSVPHLSKDGIEETAREVGEHSAYFRSKILAEFTEVGGSVVIEASRLRKLIDYCNKGIIKKTTKGRKKIGADLAASYDGDENVFVCVCGNMVIGIEKFRERDTTIIAQRLADFITQHFNNDGIDVFADDGGVGRGIIDQAEKIVNDRHKIGINRVLNQSRAINNIRFRNRGAELWFNFNRIIEENMFFWSLGNVDIDKEAAKMFEQLTNRHYKKNETLATYALLSKKEEKEEYSLSSPDRADALILAFADTTWEDLQGLLPKADVKSVGETIEQLMNARWQRHRDALVGVGSESSNELNGSIQAYLAGRRN